MESSQKEEGLSGEGSVGVEMEEKCCFDCKTTKTPLWRSGPSGPKSLCNACGIRYRKKRPTPSPSSEAAKNDLKKGKIGEKKNMKLKNDLKVNFKRLRSPRRQWGEVERAALLWLYLVVLSLLDNKYSVVRKAILL